VPVKASKWHYLTGALAGLDSPFWRFTLSFQDTSGTGKPEMIVTVGTAHYIYHNTGNAFVPPKPNQ
jgi:hypothetical protein